MLPGIVVERSPYNPPSGVPWSRPGRVIAARCDGGYLLPGHWREGPITSLSHFFCLPHRATHLTPASSKARKELLEAIPACLSDGKRDLVAPEDAAAALQDFQQHYRRAIKSSREVWALDEDSLVRYPGSSEGIE